MDSKHQQLRSALSILKIALEWHEGVIKATKSQIGKIQQSCGHPIDERESLPGDPTVEGDMVEEEYRCKVCGAIITMKGKRQLTLL